MRYVTRDSDGNVTGLFARPQSFTNERLRDDHADVLAYRTSKRKRRAQKEIEVTVFAQLDELAPKLERERAALLPDGDPAKVAALAAVEQAMVEQEVALAALAASTTAEEVEAVVQGVKE